MKNSLLATNPYLKNPEQRKLLLRRSLVSSFAIEGIQLDDTVTTSVKDKPQSLTAGN
jgi:Fic family protein